MELELLCAVTFTPEIQLLVIINVIKTTVIRTMVTLLNDFLLVINCLSKKQIKRLRLYDQVISNLYDNSSAYSDYPFFDPEL